MSGLFQPLQYGASKEEWDAWMLSVTNWANNVDSLSAGLPVTKQGIDNLMQMSGSTSKAFLMYFVTSLPPQPSYPNQVVYNGEDGRIYAWNASTSAWEPTGATAFDQLTGFLQSAQLLLGNQLNICTNGCFTNDTIGQPGNGWSVTSSYSNNPALVEPGGSTPAGCPTANCLFVQGRDTYFTAGNGFDVKPGDTYSVEGYMGSDGTTPGMQIGLYFPAVGSNGPEWDGAAQAPAGLNGWTSQKGVITVPSWANRAQVWLQVNATAAPWGNNWFTGIECAKSVSAVQQGPNINQSIVAGTTASVDTGSFVTKFVSVIHCAGYVSQQAGGPTDIGSISLLIDGNAVDYVAASTAGVNSNLSFALEAFVTSPGSHTYSIQVTNSSASYNASIISSGVKILNLIR